MRSNNKGFLFLLEGRSCVLCFTQGCIGTKLYLWVFTSFRSHSVGSPASQRSKFPAIMARIANRNDFDRMFKSIILLWPLDEDCIVNIPGNRIRDDFPFPSRFIQKFGVELDMFVYMIDDQDYAHEILLDYHNGRPFISVVSLNDLEEFYSIKRSMSLSLRYVGHGLFFLSLFDRHRHFFVNI
ncbi:hypothetical protein PIB30_018297 [Stylosanthes scabra]|uniref:Uncharacterized protein n=1 Tax=Stylosanthes scabra TaxID=79078 RepID=A0ABU6Y6W3_9FABA|nr:hypothetical protein [Stylosanthes scabra]